MKVKTKGEEQEEIVVHEFIGEKSYKAKGKRVTIYPVKKINFLDPLQIEEPETMAEEPETESEMETESNPSPVQDTGSALSETPLILEWSPTDEVQPEPQLQTDDAVVIPELPILVPEGIVVLEKPVKERKRKEKATEVTKEISPEPAKDEQKPADAGDAIQMELPL
jgi:hypothetical protein